MAVVIPVAGFSPAGLFVSQAFASASSPPGILADAIDPVTGEYLSISVGMDPIDQQVIIALTRKKGSGASVMADGQSFSDIKTVDEATAALIESQTRLALKRLVDNGDIAIASLTTSADPNNDFGWTFLQYQNLRNKGAQSRTLRINTTS